MQCNTGLGQDLVIHKQVPGVIMESLSYLRWTDLYLVADTAHGLHGSSGAMAEGQKCDYL